MKDERRNQIKRWKRTETQGSKGSCEMETKNKVENGSNEEKVRVHSYPKKTKDDSCSERSRLTQKLAGRCTTCLKAQFPWDAPSEAGVTSPRHIFRTAGASTFSRVPVTQTATDNSLLTYLNYNAKCNLYLISNKSAIPDQVRLE